MPTQGFLPPPAPSQMDRSHALIFIARERRLVSSSNPSLVFGELLLCCFQPLLELRHLRVAGAARVATRPAHGGIAERQNFLLEPADIRLQRNNAIGASLPGGAIGALRPGRV